MQAIEEDGEEEELAEQEAQTEPDTQFVQGLWSLVHRIESAQKENRQLLARNMELLRAVQKEHETLQEGAGGQARGPGAGGSRIPAKYAADIAGDRYGATRRLGSPGLGSPGLGRQSG